jgi:uncharacterized protein with HEPN domain
MLDYAKTALQFTAGRDRAALDNDLMLRYSLLHLATVLGEAANRVSAQGKVTYSQIAWRDVVGMRNKLVHG